MLNELVASIRSRGVKQPLTVRWDGDAQVYRVIDGGRRYAAAIKLGLTELPCWLQQARGRDLLVDQIVHNWQRADLKPLETAAALARLRDEHGMTQQQIAETIGKAKGEISKFLSIHDRVISSVKELAIGSGEGKAKLSKRHLYNLSKLPTSKQQQASERIGEKQLTAVETEHLVEELSRPLRKTKIRRSGIAARQHHINTSLANLVLTFYKSDFGFEEIRATLKEALDQLTETQN